MRSRTLLLVFTAASFILPATGAASVGSDTKAPDSARVREFMARGDASFESGRIKEARGIYRTLIREQRAADTYAGEALWRLAETFFAADDARGAAHALDEVAEAAARYGDPAMELKATFEAALVYQKLGNKPAVAYRLTRIKTLLQSPVVSKEQKRDIESRMEKSAH